MSPLCWSDGCGRPSRTSTFVRTPALGSCAVPITGRPRSGCCSKTWPTRSLRAVQRAVEDVAVPRGVFVLSASLDEDAAREQALCKQFGARHVDGLVLAPAGDDQSHLAGELRRGTAIVCVDREAGNLPVDSVLATNEGRRRGGGAAPRGRGPPAHRLPRRPAHDPDRGPAARGLPRRARRPRHRRRPHPGRPGHPGRVGLGRGDHHAAVPAGPPDGALHRPEHDHDRRGAGAAPPRPRTPGGARRLRRLPAGRAALAGRHGGGAGPDGDGPDGGRAAVRTDRRQHPSARGATGADDPGAPRLRRDAPTLA